MKADEPPVVVEQQFDCDAETVWRAITEVERMRQWYFDNIPEFEPRVGFKTTFLITNEGREFPHCWQVTEVVPNQKLVYTWRFDGYPGDGYVTFELLEQRDAMLLRVTTAVTEDYPDDIPEFKRESCVAGWEYFIQGRLPQYIDSIATQE